ncbi:MAG: DUF692 family multinuclear iron-containing protein [Anaerolineales bacterium]
MLFALNYSPEAADLIASGDIQVDLFKTPPWEWMITEAAAYCPVAVHFELRAGSGKLAHTDWDEIERILESTSTRYVNAHLDAKLKDFPPDFENLPPEQRQELVTQALIHDLNPLVNHFGADRVLIENAPYRGPEQTRKCRESSLPEVFHAVIAATGCDFLLDLAHARITAAAFGIDPADYIAALPHERIKELHISGIHLWGENRLQDHLELLPEDWQWLDWAIEQTRTGRWPEAHLLAFEYGGTGPFFHEHSDRQVIANQVPRMLAKIHSLNQTG